jgi:hypothetical protein
MVKVTFKIKIDGVPYFPYTMGDGEFWIDSWDKSKGGFMVVRSDAKTYDLPVYSKLFVMREANLIMENPDNP